MKTGSSQPGKSRGASFSRFDAETKQFLPFLAGISAQGVVFSKDGKSVAYASYPDDSLWKANRDGSHPVQLTDPPMTVFLPRWSPDGTQIIFAGWSPAMLTFQALANHYCRTELLAENKTPKTRKTYLVYLRNWILPKWGPLYLHLIKPVAVEQWLRSIEALSDGSKAKIRNIMSALFSHAIRFEIAEKNPIKAVRQSAKRSSVPVVLDASELQRLFSQLGVRERAMIMIEALTGIRRSELMGLKWKDVDFISGRIEITRSVVDQAVGKCKTEVSQKPVVIDENIVCALIAWRQESTYTGPDDWVWASPHRKGKQPLWLSTIMRYYIQPAVKRAGIQKKVGWHTFRHTFSSLVKSLGVDVKVAQELVRHASFGTTMNGYTQAFESSKRQAQNQLAALVMRTGSVGHA